MSKFKNLLLALLFLVIMSGYSIAQADTMVIGFGENPPSSITASSSSNGTDPEQTINHEGLLPNENAASRFLKFAGLGHSLQDIQDVSSMGFAKWVDAQINMPRSFLLYDKVQEQHTYVLNNATYNAMDPPGESRQMWYNAWYQYHMTSGDILRQRVAFALSQIVVISSNSNFGGEPTALSHYYDMFLNHAFGNYRDILQEVTYSPAMGNYLTYLNNPKSDPVNNIFPDENYAREIMQLFTIGLYELNMDGTQKLDINNAPIPTYDNDDILEFSKIFTGLSWGDQDKFGRGWTINDDSWKLPMIMWEEEHEPGVKYLLNGDSTLHDPVDGNADITDALDNLFNHPNTAPFICTFLIQRLVTANPSPAYIERVSNTFANDGNGVRGNLGAVVRAILLDEEATSCLSMDKSDFGGLSEPLIRYMHLAKALNAFTSSGDWRNQMEDIYDRTGQRPLNSPSVFNFFQRDYQPIGAVEDVDKVAPVFQITDSQTLTGWINGLYRWLYYENFADEWDLYNNEPDAIKESIRTQLVLDDYLAYTDDHQLPELLDRFNHLFAGGTVSSDAISEIIVLVKELPNTEEWQKMDRVKFSLYLLLTSPEYLVNK